MDTSELLAMYDVQQRREVIYPGVKRDVLSVEDKIQIVRLHEQNGAFNQILYSDITAENADQVIAQQIAFFKARRERFEWKTFTHDKPEDLKERLASQGFTVGDIEAVLVLDLETAPASLFASVVHDVRRIDNPDDIHGVLSVQSRVFGDTDEVDPDGENYIADQIAGELRQYADTVSVYAAFVDDVVGAAAWVRFPLDNPFASLWGAATLPDYRGQGLYTALLAVRAAEARERGRRFLTVDASPMSLPILEKFGFQVITSSYACEWEPDAQ